MRFLRDHGLTITLMILTILCISGMVASGLKVENEMLTSHGQPSIGLLDYVASGSFLSALFENWESEFLQMWAYVMLTAYLFQRGSPESKDPDKAAPQDRDAALDAGKSTAPWPVRAGGFARVVYAPLSGPRVARPVCLHWVNSARHAAAEAQAHGGTTGSLLAHLLDAQFWFESFQNWQSEFLSTALIIVLAVFLRERGSPESKPVGAPHSETGT